MNLAVRLPRVNPWFVVAIVAVVLLVAAVGLLAPMVLHTMNGFLQGPQQMAPNCGGTLAPC
jgi:uncharacterized protein (DUF2236 family)